MVETTTGKPFPASFHRAGHVYALTAAIALKIIDRETFCALNCRLLVNSHFRLRVCGGSRVLLAHTGCWGGGFCLLCRQASMTGWAQYYSRGAYRANLQREREREEDRMS